MSGLSLLITGTTGSFGSAFLRHLCATTTSAQWRRLIVYSRDEVKQSALQRELTDPRLRWFIGDIRDQDRLALACRDVQVIVHAAALKRVETMEANPVEAVKTNIVGTMHVVQVAVERGVERALLLSSDKAVYPINLYGATKACAEKLFLNANTYAGPAFSVVRYGNVAGSRGSVIPVFREYRQQGHPLPVTDPACSRFWITLSQAVAFVERSLKQMRGGELFVPRMPSVLLGDIARLMGNGIRQVGLRPGEKKDETCIAAHEYVDGLPSPYVSNENSEWLTGTALASALQAV
jgi:UDP-N-acetylglucosamine 4,6-dehydratase